MEHLPKMSHLRMHTPLVARVHKVIQCYMNKDFVHAKNECMYFSIKKDTISNQIYHVTVSERKKKLMKFLICSHMLVEGKSMIDYESMNKLLHFHNVKNFPKTHCSNIASWEMATCMHDLVVNKTKSLVEGARFISFS